MEPAAGNVYLCLGDSVGQSAAHLADAQEDLAVSTDRMLGPDDLLGRVALQLDEVDFPIFGGYGQVDEALVRRHRDGLDAHD